MVAVVWKEVWTTEDPKKQSAHREDVACKKGSSRKAERREEKVKDMMVPKRDKWK